MKTLTELYQDCKRKQKLKEFMSRLNNIPDGSLPMLCYLLSCTYYTTYLYLLIPLVIFWGEHFEGTF